MPKSPLSYDYGIITIDIFSDGSHIPDTFQVFSVKIHRELNSIPYAEIKLNETPDIKNPFAISDSNTFLPGKEIEIKGGYNSRNETLFKGIVLSQKLSIRADQIPVLIIICKDKAIKMTRHRRNANFAGHRDSEIMEKVCSHNGLSSDISNTSNINPTVLQYNTTDWDFLISRAKLNGMVVNPMDGKLIVSRPDKAGDVPLQLSYGIDFLSLDAEISAEHQYDAVTANGWSSVRQELISHTEAPANWKISNLSTKQLSMVIGQDAFSLQSGAAISEDDLAAWSKAAALRSSLNKFQGTASFMGSALAIPGTLIQLSGLSNRWNGHAYISGVEHNFIAGNWTTTITMGLSADATDTKSEITSLEKSSLSIQGLQIGKVKKISDDPDSEFRVLIALPLIKTVNEGLWARLSTLYAGEGVGAFFYPEIGDEVIVGFLDNDPSSPIILGSVHSSSRMPPFSPEEKNNIKGFCSRSKMKIQFDDKNKTITLETPSGSSIQLDDSRQAIVIKDQNNNAVTMNASGIELKSPGDISIKAGGKLDMHQD